ncbi:MAG: hypothetical protein JRJ79_00960 [Deltaproteobacteria bacterium]|nr:hypothetical protein [Deltaproteobacteria bacterium]MBW1793465.1 hypothetical protein [Deltaproteobacteria bacterium]
MAKSKGVSWKVKPGTVNMKLVDGTIVQATINLGSEARVSDLFTRSGNPFVVVFDAKFPGSMYEKVLIVNKRHIVWIEPEIE